MYLTTQNIKKIFSAIFIGGIFTYSNAQTLAATQKLGKESNVYQPVYNPVDDAVYVSAAKDFKTDGTIYKLNSSNLQVVDSIKLPEIAPLGLGINIGTQMLYSTGTKSIVTAIDLKTGKQTFINNPVPGTSAREVLVDEKRNKIYVTSVKAGGIWVIDGKTNTFERYIYNLGNAITGVTLNSEKNLLYATAMRDNQIVVVNADTGVVQEKFDAHGKRPTNVYYDYKNDRLFVANQESADITVLDAKTGELIKEIPTGEGALGVDYDTQRNRIYVANRAARTVNVIDGTSLKITKTFDMEGLPNTFAINQHNGNVYVTLKDAPKPRKAKEESGPVVPAKNGDAVALFKK